MTLPIKHNLVLQNKTQKNIYVLCGLILFNVICFVLIYFQLPIGLTGAADLSEDIHRKVLALVLGVAFVLIINSTFFYVGTLVLRGYLKNSNAVMLLANYKSVLESHFMTIEFDVHGSVLSVNDAFVKVSGYSEAELKKITHYMHHEFELPYTFDQVFQGLLAGNIWQGNYQKKKKSGEQYWVQATFSPYQDESSQLLKIIAVYTEVTPLVQLTEKFNIERKSREHLARINRELALNANTDPLTGLFNRRALASFFTGSMENAIKLSEPVALLILDIDFFKSINDTYGHIVGDQILVQITQRWRTQIRASDMLARIGGEEFCLMLPSANLAQAELVAQKILDVTNGDLFLISYDKKDHQIKVTTSMGITCSNMSEQITLEKMMEVADNALFQSKERGKNCFTSLHLDI